MKKILLSIVLFILINTPLSYGADKEDLDRLLYYLRGDLNTAILALDKVGREVNKISEELSQTDIHTIGNALTKEMKQRQALKEAQQALQECQQQLNQQN